MTRQVGDTIIFEAEPEQTCDLCGSFEETRPYGPNGENVCFACGMKNKQAAMSQFYKRFGMSH